MVNPVNTPPQVLPQESAESEMGRTDFLKLLVAQLKNQDPLKPMENTEFVSQLAQFSSLEQTIGINSRLDLLSLQSRGSANTDAVGFIGKEVTVVGSAVTLDSSGTGAPIRFELQGPSENTRVVVRSETGKVVRSLDLGSRDAGLVTARWDGKDDNGLAQPPGNYTISVEAKSKEGSAVYATQKTQGTVTGVSFDRGYAVLTLDNGITAPVSDLIEVQEPGAQNP